MRVIVRRNTPKIGENYQTPSTPSPRPHPNITNMRLELIQHEDNQHQDIVSNVAWSSADELYSCSDDKTIRKWGAEGETLGTISEVDSHIMDMDWAASSGPSRNLAGPEIFAIACSDGTLRLMNRTGREEKRVEAHKGAVLCIKWSQDGAALITGGEDGTIKQWSQKGMMRSQLVQSEHPVYDIEWAPDGQFVLYTSSQELVLKPLKPNAKQSAWKAHEAPVLQVAWNPITHLIVSGGEDCKYKVWDSFGRLLFSSSMMEHVVSAVSWSPDGELLAVGTVNVLRLCDKSGWVYSRETTQTGSIYNFSWSVDGTQLAAAGGNGSIVFGHVTGRRLEWRNIVATLIDPLHVKIEDVLSEAVEELDFRDPVVHLSLGFGHFVAATSRQCYVYSVDNWNTPHIFDVKNNVKIIKQCPRYFLTVDKFGVQVYSYEGRMASKLQRNTDQLSTLRVSLCNDAFAIVDPLDHSVVNVFDVRSGKPLGPQIKHGGGEVLEIGLDNNGTSTERRLALVDSTRDLYITPVMRPNLVKLSGMSESMMWSDNADVLAAISDGKFVIWLWPGVVYVDKDLLNATRVVSDAGVFGKNPIITSFSGTIISIRRADGALVYETVSPHVAMLQEHVDLRDWEEATRLCRVAKDSALWACLAAMAVAGEDLDTAEVALAAIDEVDKLYFIQHVKRIPSKEGRAAEMALYRGERAKAETILMQAGLWYRAIKMNIRLFRWENALMIAEKNKTHIDTVLAYRERFLEQRDLKENLPNFKRLKNIKVDWEQVKIKIAADKTKEKQRPSRK